MKDIKNLDWYLIDDKWHHCIWTFDNGKMKQYVDRICSWLIRANGFNMASKP